MNIVIVPSHNQAEHIPKIISAYSNQTILPDLLLFVLDRYSEKIQEIFSKKILVKYITKTTGENFSAGLTRDFGVSFVQENYPDYNTIIFSDGDCIPSEKFLERHLENLNQNFPIVSCGKRFKQDIDGKFQDDERCDRKWVNEYSFTNKNGRMIVANYLTLETIFTYSCNLGFNKLSVELCQSVNEKLGSGKRVFNSYFDGSWGGEDNFISHILYRCGGYILLTSEDCFVNHFYHLEQKKNHIEKNKKLKELSKKLEAMVLSGVFEGPIQNVKKGLWISFGPHERNNIKNIVDVEGVDFRVWNILEWISEKYSKNDKIVFKNFLTNNRKENFLGISCKDISDFDIHYYKEFLGYLKFYFRNGDVVFEDDVKRFEMKLFGNSFLDYK
jgi:hypothetical protein